MWTGISALDGCCCPSGYRQQLPPERGAISPAGDHGSARKLMAEPPIAASLKRQSNYVLSYVVPTTLRGQGPAGRAPCRRRRPGAVPGGGSRGT